MAKLYFFFIFLLAFFSPVMAAHPLAQSDKAVLIDYIEGYKSYLFIPIKKIENDSVIGLLVTNGVNVLDDNDKIVSSEENEPMFYVYCAVPKYNDICDVYLLSTGPFSGKAEIDEILEIKPVNENKVRLRYEILSDTPHPNFHTKRNFAQLKEEVASNFAPKMLKALINLAEGIAKEYKISGRSGVRRMYGASSDESFEKSMAEARRKHAEKVRLEQVAREKSSPLSKKIKYELYEGNGTVKILSKKISYKDGRIYWTCTVKNLTRSTIERCYVTIKCYDKDGIEITDSIERADYLSPKSTQTISDYTQIPESEARKIKRVTLKINTY